MIVKSENFDVVVSEKMKGFDINLISDDVITLYKKIINSSLFEWEISTDEKNRIIFKNNLCNFCTLPYSVQDFINSFDEEDGEIYKRLFNKSCGTFKIGSNVILKHCDEKCIHGDCIKGVFAALLICQDNGTLDDLLAKRTEPVGFFKFKWTPEKTFLRNVPENIFQFAKQMVEKRAISLSPTLNDNGHMSIFSAYTCDDFQFANLGEETVFPASASRTMGNYSTLRRTTNCPVTKICNSASCRHMACPVVVAAYLYYLYQSNQAHIIDEERRYYHEHEEEMVAQANDAYNVVLQKYLSDRINNDVVKKFEQFNDNTENLDLLVQSIANRDRNCLYFAVEREEGISEKEIIDEVVSVLKNDGKIEGTIKISMSTIYGDIQKCVDKQLTIINSISSFKANHKESYAAKESLIKLLCHPQKNRYIIIVGTKEELDWLKTYSAKLKYVYEHFYVKINDLTIDQLYNIYKMNLEPLVFEKLTQSEDDARIQFDDFIKNNRSIFPFKNLDLAKYMAQYSNSHGDLVFPPYVYKAQTLDEALGGVIGMNNVKKQMKDLEQYITFINKSKSLGLKTPSMNLHMIFNGNPGTGKTMMARVMARMLYDIGMIKENKLIEAERKDLIADFVGQTAGKTASVINKAMGGVLFIDEAYTLTPTSEKDFGSECIATLIKAMEDHKDELVVIFAGYEKEMHQFVESNPGIASRIGYKFNFDDYDADELLQIFQMKMSKNGFSISEEANAKVLKLANIISKRRNFGNGRFVDKVVQQVLIKHSKTSNENLYLINEDSIPTIQEYFGEEANENVDYKEALNNVIGMDSLKQRIFEFANYVAFSKEAEKNGIKLPPKNLHMLFTGNPGCGKTTIARVIAKLLFDMEVIQENKLIEVSSKDLIGSYTGQTAPKTAEVIERAMGGVLFIDEAYSISNSHTFGEECVATLIKYMEDYKGQFVTIFAGYKKEMAQFLNTNSGIASRIGYTFDFPDYTPDELRQIYELKLNKSGLELTDAAKSHVQDIMRYFHKVDGIGNGRFADRILQDTLGKHAELCVNKKERSIKIIDVDSIPTIDEIIDGLANGSSMLRPDQVDIQSIRKTAIHEVGHAYVRYKLFSDPNIVKITIRAEGAGTLGYVEHKVDK